MEGPDIQALGTFGKFITDLIRDTLSRFQFPMCYVYIRISNR